MDDLRRWAGLSRSCRSTVVVEGFLAGRSFPFVEVFDITCGRGPASWCKRRPAARRSSREPARRRDVRAAACAWQKAARDPRRDIFGRPRIIFNATTRSGRRRFDTTPMPTADGAHVIARQRSVPIIRRTADAKRLDQSIRDWEIVVGTGGRRAIAVACSHVGSCHQPPQAWLTSAETSRVFLDHARWPRSASR